MATRPVTVNDVLHGHVVLDLESFDRIYLNGYVPSLQVGGQVVGFRTRHLGFPIPSPALLEKIGNRFRLAVRRFAADHDVPVVRFGKGDRKLDVMRPHLDRLAAQGRCPEADELGEWLAANPARYAEWLFEFRRLKERFYASEETFRERDRAVVLALDWGPRDSRMTVFRLRPADFDDAVACLTRGTLAGLGDAGHAL